MMIFGEIGEFLALHDAEAGHAVRQHFVCLGQRQREFAHAGAQIIGRAFARHKGGERGGIELVFGELDPPREGFGGIAGDDRDRRLCEDWPLIDSGRHDMDAASAEWVARVDRLRVGVQPLVEREKAGVDVEHPARPTCDEIVRQDTHIARQRDIFGARGAQLFVDQRVEGVAFHALVRQRPGRDAFGLGNLQSQCVGIVARDKHEFIRAVGSFCRIEQRRHIGAGARDQDGDLGFGHGAAPSIRSC